MHRGIPVAEEPQETPGHPELARNGQREGCVCPPAAQTPLPKPWHTALLQEMPGWEAGAPQGISMLGLLGVLHLSLLTAEEKVRIPHALNVSAKL